MSKDEVMSGGDVSEKDLLEKILNGTFCFRRFNRKEQSCSSDSSDRFLWLALLRAELELSSANGRGMSCGSQPATGGTSAAGRFLDTLAQDLPNTFGEVQRQAGRFEDRGQESVVFDGGDGFVYKLRLMRPSILTGYIAPLANIVYHNALFARERYTLETIYRQNDRYFTLLRQQRVDIALDSSGYPVKPTAESIRMAVFGLKAGLVEYERDEIVDDEDSSSGESEVESGVHLKFYNSDYYISDFQPGRNTVIDAGSGEVRFIDPRITLNDPDGPITPVSGFGKRREQVPPMIF